RLLPGKLLAIRLHGMSLSLSPVSSFPGREGLGGRLRITPRRDRVPRAVTDAPRPALRILVVDDEEPVRRLVDRMLSDAGYRPVIASDGPEAIDLAATQTFDLLVTDLMMPQMNGDELARRLRQKEPSLKVLYLTGFSDRLFKEKVTLLGDE